MLDQISIGIDHRMVTASVSINTKGEWARMTKTKTKKKWQDPENSAKFENTVTEALEIIVRINEHVRLRFQSIACGI